VRLGVLEVANINPLEGAHREMISTRVQRTGFLSRTVRKVVRLLFLLLSLGLPTFAAQYYVSPTGSPSGNGSITNPWDLHTGITAHSVVKPGDTIWVRGGTYTYSTPWQFTVNLTGTAAQPIVIRRYPGEWAVWDLQNNGSAVVLDNPTRLVGASDSAYVWIWGIEITATGIPRSTSNSGSFGIGSIVDIEIHGVGVKFINCYVHDMHAGFGFWVESSGSELYGSIIGDVGWNAPDRGHGHGIYAQNDATGLTKYITDNFIYNTFDIGMQWYGSGAALIQNITGDGNIILNAGMPIGQGVGQLVIAGGGASKKGIVYNNGVVFVSPQLNGGFSQIGWSFDGVNQDADVEGNYFGRDIELWHWNTLKFLGNTVEGRISVQPNTSPIPPPPAYTLNNNWYASDVSFAGTSAAGWKTALAPNESNSTFNGTLGLKVIVRPNKYEAGRANIVILNPLAQATVAVDISQVGGLQEGDPWQLCDVQNFRSAPIMTGTYHAAATVIQVPMSGLVPVAIQGWSTLPSHSAPYLGTFVFLGGAAYDGSGTGSQLPAVAFTATPASIQAGTSSLLSWSVTGATSVSISGFGAQPATGSLSVSPAATTTYVLTATNANGNTVQQQTVTVTAAPPATGAVPAGKWTFDTTDISGGQALDSSGNNLNLTIANATSVPGKINQALGFNGTNSSLASTDTVATQLNTNLTLAAWIKTSNATRNEAIISKYDSGGTESGYLFKTTAAGTLGVRFGSNILASHEVADSTKINDGNWHHVAFTVTLGQDVRFYVDGTLRSTNPEATVAGLSNAAFQVGSMAYQYYAMPFTGSIDEVRLYRQALNATDIAALYNQAGDTTPPTVSIASPGAGQVSGTVTVSATANDNVGVAGVQFQLNGSNLGSEDLIGPYSLNWDTTTVANGPYTLTAIARDAAGNRTTSAGVAVTVNNTAPPPSGSGSASATFLTTDTSSQGNWNTAYGGDGYSIANDSSSYPSYAQVAVNQASAYTWANPSSDPRALTKGSGSGRIASAWYSATSFSFDVNLTDGKAHQVSLYLLDFDSNARSETVAILDAASGASLDSRSASSFHGGEYLAWNLTGHVTIRVTRQGGANAAVSGLFFGVPAVTSVQFLTSDSTTQGSWIGHYGKDGTLLAGTSNSGPAYAVVTMAGQTSYVWAASTTDTRALQNGSTRIAATWYTPTTYTIDIKLTDQQTHTISVYGLDWDSTTRAETITVRDAATGATLDSRSLSNFHSGQYLSWSMSGHVILSITMTGGFNAVLSGLFFN
jgi:hypothetical protein